jgi:hypothetical protein
MKSQSGGGRAGSAGKAGKSKWPQVRSSRLDGGFVLYWASLATPVSNNPGAPHLRQFEFRLPMLAEDPPPHITASVHAEPKLFVGGAYSVSVVQVNFGLNDQPEYATQIVVRAEAPPYGTQRWTHVCNLVVIAMPLKSEARGVNTRGRTVVRKHTRRAARPAAKSRARG